MTQDTKQEQGVHPAFEETIAGLEGAIAIVNTDVRLLQGAATKLTDAGEGETVEVKGFGIPQRDLVLNKDGLEGWWQNTQVRRATLIQHHKDALAIATALQEPTFSQALRKLALVCDTPMGISTLICQLYYGPLDGTEQDGDAS